MTNKTCSSSQQKGRLSRWRVPVCTRRWLRSLAGLGKRRDAGLLANVGKCWQCEGNVKARFSRCQTTSSRGSATRSFCLEMQALCFTEKQTRRGFWHDKPFVGNGIVGTRAYRDCKTTKKDQPDRRTTGGDLAAVKPMIGMKHTMELDHGL